MSVLHICLLAVVPVVFAAAPPPRYEPYAPAPAPYKQPAYDEPTEPPVYNYGYAVQDDYEGVDFTHNEARDEYLTQGKYVVRLPDSRTQIVTYEDNGDGVVYNVVYEGEAQYPPEKQYKPDAPRPGYAAQPPYPYSRR